jgi:hypothetical protein
LALKGTKTFSLDDVKKLVARRNKSLDEQGDYGEKWHNFFIYLAAAQSI